MAINRRRSRRAPEDEDYLDDEKITRRPADEDDDDERPARRTRRSRDDDDDEDERPARKTRRSRDEDDEDEPPSRRSRRSRDEDDDDEEDERPARKSRRNRDDEDDEEDRPARKSRRNRDDEDDEEDRPARKSRRSRDEDEEEPPARRSRRSRDEDEERPARRSRRSRDEEEEDEDEGNDSSSLIQSGWGAAKKKMSESGNFTNEFRFDESEKVVKFLSNEPLVYQQHWIERTGKKSFVCIGDRCPLCKAGDVPSAKYAWPVLNFNEDPVVAQLLVCGTKLAKQLEKLDNDRRHGPLDKKFWALSKTGKQQSTSYMLEPVKEDDLAVDWDIDPDDALDAIESTKIPGEEAINVTPRDELIDIARELR